MVFSVVAAFIIVAVAVQRSGEGWGTWLLVLIAKTYSGLFFRLRVRQPSPLGPGGMLVIVNHRSPVDPLFMLATTARDPFRGPLTLIEFLTASEYTRIPGAINFICKRMRAIPVDRDGEDMESAKVARRRLQAGHTVGIFPEGRINFGPGLLKPNLGVAWLALTSNCPVITAFIHNAPQTASKSMVAPFLTRTHVRVDFGDPIDLSAYKGVRVSPAILAEVSQMLMQKLAETGGIETSGLKLVGADQRVPA